MSKIITVTEGNLPSGVKTSQVKTKEQKGDFAKGSNKTITLLQNIKSTEYPIKALVAGDNINLTQSRSLFLKFDPNSFGAFYSDRSMDRIGKIQSITIIPSEPKQVAIEIGDTYYIFNYDDIFVHTNMVSKASASSSSTSSAPNSPSSFFNNNGVDQSNTKGYIGTNIQSDFCDKVMKFIESNNLKNYSNLPPRNIDDVPEFYVFVESTNSRNICDLYQINLRTIESRQIISGSNKFRGDNVLFTYKLSDFNFFNNDNELYVPTKELYYREPAAPIPRGEKEPASKGISVGSPSFASSKSVPSASSIGLPPPPKDVLPLKTTKVAAEDHLYTAVNSDDINGLKRITLPFDTNTENLYVLDNRQLYEIPNVSSVEPIVGSDDLVEVTQIKNDGIPVKLQYTIDLLYQAPKNDDKLLRANLQKIYSNLQDSAKREVAAGLQQPTPSQIQFEKFNTIMGNESIGDLEERYNVYLKSVSEPPKSDVEVNVAQPVNGITNYDSNTFNKRFYNLYAREREGGTYKIYQLKNIIDVIPQKDNSIRVTLRKNDGSIYIKNFYNKGQLTQAPKTDAEIDEEIIKEYNELKSAAEKETAASGIKSGISSSATPKSSDFEKFKATMGLTSGLPPSLVAAASSVAPASVAPSSASSSVPVAPLVAKYKALYHYKPPPPGPTTIKTSTAPAPAATAATAAPTAPPAPATPAPGSSNKSTAKGLQPGSSKASSSSPSSPSSSSTAATIVNQTSSIKPPEIVPNELFIVLNTSIPGSQKIFYNPKMTIKGSNAKSIRFDPLVELEPSVINKVPKDLRIKQFFDKGLFESLINLHGMKNVMTLIEAMNDGIINNNILVTLNTIFAINTPIYINGEVYYIGDVQWTQGDWTIDTKEKPVSFDVSKIKNPYIYSAVVNDDIISGQSQLKALSPNVLTGANYKGLPPQMNATPSSLSTISPLSTLIGVPVAQGVQPQLIPVPSTATTTATTPAATPAAAQNINVQVTSPALEAAAAALAAQAQAKAQPLAITAGPPPSIPPPVAKRLALPPSVLPGSSVVPGKAYPAILPSSSPSISLGKALPSSVPAAKGVVAKTNTSKISKQPVPPPGFIFRSQLYSNFFRSVFGTGKGSSSGIYYTTMNLLYQGINDEKTKGFIKTVEQSLTTTNVKGVDSISKTAYDKTVADLRIATTDPDGNCFFQSIAIAINNYNYTNQEIGIATRIGYEVKGIIYGGSTPFNQETIRFVVFDFLQGNAGYLFQMLEAQKEVLDAKNNEFRTAFDDACGLQGLAILVPGTKIPRGDSGRYSTLYTNVVTSEYNKSHPGFASQTERNMPVDITQLYQPFSFIDGLITRTNSDGTIADVNYNVLEQYITQGSVYWGDATAIDAVNIVLKINTIVIKKGNQGLANSISSQITGVFTNNVVDEMKHGLDMTKWTTFLFLYYIEDLTKPDQAAHYELFTFLFPVQRTETDSKSNIQTTYPERRFTIFNKNDIQHPPPLYMLLLIFGFKYMSPGQVPADFDFFSGFNQSLNSSYQSIISRPGNNADKCKLLNNLFDLFLWQYLEQLITDAGCKRTNRNKKSIRFASDVSGVPKSRRIRRSSAAESGDEADTSGIEEGGISEIDGGAVNRRTRRNYNYNYNNNYNNNNNYPNNFLKRDAVRDVSKIGYYISIDLELKKGSPLTPEEISESKCTRKWNSVRKAFANFTGKTYAIPPVYDYSNKQTLKNKSNNKPNNVTKSNKPPPPQTQVPPPPPKTNLENPTNKTGGTRKNEVKQIYLNGKHNKTMKKL